MLSSTLSWIFRGYIDSAKKKKGPKVKPRPVIVRLASCKKRMEFMYKKSKLKVHSNFNGVNLTKDLTSLRAKMLKYAKEVGKNKFVLFHTINGKIRMKQSAQEAGQSPTTKATQVREIG